MNPLVTVAIAAYNVETYLRRGIQQVLNQTYENLEIILVDDGSTDKTAKMCDDIATEDSRIRVFHKENGGLGSARNVGIEQAKGKYLYFFDVDDFLEPNLIEENVKEAEEKQVDLIIFGFFARIEGEQREEKITLQEELISSNQQLKEKYCSELLFIRHGNGFAWNKFYRMSFLREYGFKFGNQRIQQDEPFNMQLYLKLERVYVSSKAFYHYVIYSSGNAGSRYLPNRFEIVTDVYHRFMDFYTSWELDDENVLQYIRKRYAAGIYQAVTANCFHVDCKLNLLGKYQHIKKILSHPEARECIAQVWGTSTRDPILICIRKRWIVGLMIMYRSKQRIKHLLNRGKTRK